MGLKKSDIIAFSLPLCSAFRELLPLPIVPQISWGHSLHFAKKQPKINKKVPAGIQQQQQQNLSLLNYKGLVVILKDNYQLMFILNVYLTKLQLVSLHSLADSINRTQAGLKEETNRPIHSF